MRSGGGGLSIVPTIDLFELLENKVYLISNRLPSFVTLDLENWLAFLNLVAYRDLITRDEFVYTHILQRLECILVRTPS